MFCAKNGDRRVADVIVKAYEKGCIFDAWGEYFRNQLWLDAFKECGVSIDFYNTRERSIDEIFPWDIIDCGVSKEFLLKEWQKALSETVTPNCRKQCNACGAAKYGCGVCVEDRSIYNDEETIARTGEVLHD